MMMQQYMWDKHQISLPLLLLSIVTGMLIPFSNAPFPALLGPENTC
jgi:flagellar biosynthesis protein FliQ